MPHNVHLRLDSATTSLKATGTPVWTSRRPMMLSMVSRNCMNRGRKRRNSLVAASSTRRIVTYITYHKHPSIGSNVT